MSRRASALPLTALAAVFLLSAGSYIVFRSAEAKERPDWHNGLPQQYKSKWFVHDDNRPKPPAVTPGPTSQDAPSDAVVLFDGKDLSKWQREKGGPAGWKVENGAMEVNNTGSIKTVENFGDCQLHLEWMSPTPTQQSSQGRGNSGIILMERYEIQVLDNYDNETYADGYVGSVYGQHPAMANASRKPGEWQTYDVVFRAPRFADGKLVEPARVTALVNGILVQHNAEVFGRVAWRHLAKYTPHDAEAPLFLQDHGDKQAVRFRNIWIRRLDLSRGD